MQSKDADRSVLDHIGHLVAEEHHLIERGSLDASDSNRLKALQVQLDQCWDLLRQRRALRSAGQNPDEAHARDVDTVEKYLQ